MRASHRDSLLIAIVGSFTLAGCFGGGGGIRITAPSAASMEYRLPVTTAKVSMQLTLEDCTAQGPVAESRVTITPVANPGSLPQEHYRIDGAHLQSFTRSRSVTVDRYANDAIKSINSDVSDRTGAIISNFLNIAAGLIGFGADPGNPVGGHTCNVQTTAALRQVAALRGQITALRGRLSTAAPKEAIELRNAADGLAAEIARLRTEELQLTLEREISFRTGVPGVERTKGGVIEWEEGKFAKWLEVDQSSKRRVAYFRLAFCVDPTSEPRRSECSAETAKNDGDAERDQLVELTAALEADLKTQQQARGVVPKPACFHDDMSRRCPLSIVFRDPVPALLHVVVGDDRAGAFKGKPLNAVLGRSDLQIAQWGIPAELPLSVGFGGSFTMAAAFDEFGRRTSFSWKSGARGEGLTGGLSSIVTGATAVRNALTTELEAQQQEITRLETQQKLNRLEYCRQIIEAGGFTCPAS